MKAKPSEYVRRHFRAATAPAQLPADPAQAAQLGQMLGASDMLVFASDFPHEIGPDDILHEIEEVAEAPISDADKRAVLRDNAKRFYQL